MNFLICNGLDLTLPSSLSDEVRLSGVLRHVPVCPLSGTAYGRVSQATSRYSIRLVDHNDALDYRPRAVSRLSSGLSSIEEKTAPITRSLIRVQGNDSFRLDCEPAMRK